MGKFVKAIQKSSLNANSGTALNVEDKSIALFNVNGQFYAIDNQCRHRGGPLGEGSLDGNVVACPWHGFLFDVTTGNCVTNPALKQTCYPLKIEGDDILIEI